MKQINEAFESQSEYQQVKALMGITLLHRGLTHGLGFEQQQMKSGFFTRITTVYLRLLLSAMHPEGRKELTGALISLYPCFWFTRGDR